MSEFIVGLTGGIASGKTTVSDHFGALGVTIIDADIIARQVVAVGTPALKAIQDHFGNQAILDNGQLNREWLRNTIFAHNESKQWLNELMHPIIREEMLLQCRQASSIYCILSVPLLIENNLNALVDRILVVDVDPKVQLARAMIRDGSQQSIIEGIIHSQCDRQTRLAAAHNVIDNSKGLHQLNSQIAKLHEQYIQLARCS